MKFRCDICRLGCLAVAVIVLGSCHQVHEARARKLANSALESVQRGDYDQALELSERALRLGSDDPLQNRLRAVIFLIRGDATRGLEEADAALEKIATIDSDPNHPQNPIDQRLSAECHSIRASALDALGSYAESQEAMKEAVRLHPDNAVYLNGLAWHLATIPEDSLRDGKLAITHAKKACELTNWKSPALIDTLAAAFAEDENYIEAVKWQREASKLLKPEDMKGDPDGFAKRLALYQKKQPFREDPQEEFQKRHSETEE